MSHQFLLGRCPLELAQRPSRVALAPHNAGRSAPFGVTKHFFPLPPQWHHLHQTTALPPTYQIVDRHACGHSAGPETSHSRNKGILAEGAIALPVTLSGGALFAS